MILERTNNVEIFSKMVTLVPKGETVLENGDNEYDFSVKLPSDARSSVNFPIGNGRMDKMNRDSYGTV